MQRLSVTHKVLFLVAVVLLIGGIVSFLPHTHANPGQIANTIPLQNTGLLLYSSFDGNKGAIGTQQLLPNAPQVVSDCGGASEYVAKELFLSPDRKLVARRPIGLRRNSPPNPKRRKNIATNSKHVSKRLD